jgi:hypothetical protein
MRTPPILAADGGTTARQILDTAGQIAGVILVLELTVAVALFAALMVALWFAVRWVRFNVTPLFDLYGAQAEDALAIATRSTDRVTRGVAEFYSQSERFKAAILGFVVGPTTARELLRPSAERTPAPPPGQPTPGA